MQRSGFVLVDGKGDRDLYGKALALARAFGRDDDIRVLSFMVASGVKDSHTFNPFSIGNADALRELLASQLGEPSSNDSNGVFRERAVALIGTLAPALIWLRDTKGVELTIEVIRFSIELRWIWKLAMEKIAVLRDPETGIERELDVSADVPEDITWPLRSYLGELPGVNTSVPLNKQGEEPLKQHGYAQSDGVPVTTVFNMLASSAHRRVPGAGPSATGQPNHGATARAIERGAGASCGSGDAAAATFVDDLKGSLTDTVRVEPPVMTATEFTAALRSLSASLDKAAAPAVAEAA